MGFPESYYDGYTDEESLQKAVAAVREVLQRAEDIGCTLALYNHGGWYGEPENLMRIIDAIGSDKIKIVYNFHHAEFVQRGHRCPVEEVATKVTITGMTSGIGGPSGYKMMGVGIIVWTGSALISIDIET